MTHIAEPYPGHLVPPPGTPEPTWVGLGNLHLDPNAHVILNHKKGSRTIAEDYAQRFPLDFLLASR